MAGTFSNQMIAPAILGSTTLDSGAFVDASLSNKQTVNVGGGFVGTGDGGPESFIDHDGGTLVGEAKHIKSFGGIEAAIWTSVIQGGIFVGSAALILARLLFLPEGAPGAVVSHAYHAGKFNFGNFELGWETLYRDEATAWILLFAGFFYCLLPVLMPWVAMRFDRKADELKAAISEPEAVL